MIEEKKIVHRNHGSVRIDREKVRKMVEYGMKDWEIAKMVGCCVGSVRRIRSFELGIESKYGRKKAGIRVIDDEARRHLGLIMKYLHDRRYSYEKIARISKMNYNTVYKLIKEVEDNGKEAGSDV